MIGLVHDVIIVGQERGIERWRHWHCCRWSGSCRPPGGSFPAGRCRCTRTLPKRWATAHCELAPGLLVTQPAIRGEEWFGGLRGIVVLEAHRIGIEQLNLALLIGGGEQHAQPAAHEGVGDQAREALVEGAAQIVVAALSRSHQGEALMIEGMRRVELDGRAQRAFMQIGGRGLVDRDAGEQVGIEHVEVEGTADIVAGVRDRFHAVYFRRREQRRQAAHRDLLALAAAAVQRDAGNALDGFRQVGVGKFGDVFRQDGVDGVGRRCAFLPANAPGWP